MSQDPFTNLVALLRQAGFEPDAEGIADAIWFAQFQPSALASQSSPNDSPAGGNKRRLSPIPSTEERRSLVGPDPQPEPDPAPEPNPEPAPNLIFPDVVRPDPIKRRASPVVLPGVAALPGALEIGRALRPFCRRLPSRDRWMLDEEATAEATALSGLVHPVLVPLPERWFDVALVVDGSRSMDVWRRPIEEFERLLSRQGAFEHVSRWRLSVSEDAVSVFSGGQRRQPSALQDPRRRTLILIVTNGVAPFWDSGAIAEVLAAWSAHAPVGILQVFSESRWSHTVLGSPTREVRSILPGAVGRKLAMKRVRREQPGDAAKIVAVPILSLAAGSVARWAKAVMAASPESNPAVVFAPDVATPSEDTTRPIEVPIAPRARVERFRSIASREAFRLACHLSAVPLVLPIIRVVHQRICQRPVIEDLGEVLASGLLERVTPDDPSIDPDKVLYEFSEGVRDIFLNALPMGSIVDIRTRVQTALKQFVERFLDSSIDNFRAFVLDPHGTHDLPATVKAILEVERNLLLRLRRQTDGQPLDFPVVRRLLDKPGNLRRIAWSPDGTCLASAGYDGLIVLWDVESGQIRRTMAGHQGVVYSVSWSRDSEWLASGSIDGTVIVWDVFKGSVEWVASPKRGPILSVAWSQNDKTIACGTDGGAVFCLDRLSGAVDKAWSYFRGGSSVHTVAWSPDDTFLACATNDGINAFALFTRDFRPYPVVAEEEMYGLAWSPDRYLMAVSGQSGKISLIGLLPRFTPDPSARLGKSGGVSWTPAFGVKLEGELRGHTMAATDLTFSKDGDLLASLSWDNTVRIWDIRNNHREITTLPIESSRRFHSGIAFGRGEDRALAVVTLKGSAIEILEPAGGEGLKGFKEASRMSRADNGSPRKQRLLAFLKPLLGSSAAVDLIESDPRWVAKTILRLQLTRKDVFATYLRVVEHYTGSGWNQLFLKRGKDLVVVAEVIGPHRQKVPHKLASGVVAAAATRRKPVWAAEVTGEPSTSPEFAVPLLSLDRALVGVIAIELDQNSPLTSMDAQWLTQYCEPVADWILSSESLRRQWHPSEDIDKRDNLRRCTFTVRRDYASRGKRRWKEWADVLVDLRDSPNRDFVYLLPSAFAPASLRIPKDDQALEQKRILTTKFIVAKVRRKIEGWWFYKNMSDGASRVHVYSREYDDFLRDNLRSNDKRSRISRTRKAKNK